MQNILWPHESEKGFLIDSGNWLNWEKMEWIKSKSY